LDFQDLNVNINMKKGNFESDQANGLMTLA